MSTLACAPGLLILLWLMRRPLDNPALDNPALDNPD